MLELWNELVAWFKSSGVDVALDAGSIGAFITSAVLVCKSFKNTKRAEIVAVSENRQLSKEYKETSSEIVNIKESVVALENIMQKLIGLNMILLENAKIPADAKEKAMELFTTSTEKVNVVIKKVEDVVERIEESVKETIAKEKEQEKSTNTDNIYLTNLDGLVYGQNTTK